ncbi:RICIN domain-containing protein [Chlorogloeopsis sp. ULAP01]
MEDAGDGYFYIIGKQSGKVLQVNGGNKDNSANVDQWTKKR